MPMPRSLPISSHAFDPVRRAVVLLVFAVSLALASSSVAQGELGPPSSDTAQVGEGGVYDVGDKHKSTAKEFGFIVIIAGVGLVVVAWRRRGRMLE